ncbi:aminoglycoside 6-adenylyltransferase [Paenibacillus sp. 1001270B_150601_E10]|uniref:aminoglycoside 6-adenylyltransferase n=1 Tax=Paenibacillus sp. 1001270B_150601_E10 TaxID=2787079 RepID=UPI00189EED5B|nr:aminoglycoside 6-adenylyltransferase [Paenibacillus sp. 1001270B_150601_E10]
MRSKQEMMELVLRVAREDERVRAVGMNGSRTNPNVPRDMFQDYDIVYLVTDMESFIQDPHWIDVFGERLIMQMPEAMSMFPPDLGRWFSYLMLFEDGNRIDMILIPIEEKETYLQDDKLTVILMDKDQALPEIPPPTDEDYWVKRPSAAIFADCCNEFWWVCTYVAKGLWRQEILFAQEHLHSIVRPMLMKMLSWKVGIETDFSLSVGKCGKYLKTYMTDEAWNKLMATYPNGTYDGVWNALFTMCGLFRETALFVADKLGFEYPIEDDRKVTGYLERVRKLPSNATEM